MVRSIFDFIREKTWTRTGGRNLRNSAGWLWGSKTWEGTFTWTFGEIAFKGVKGRGAGNQNTVKKGNGQPSVYL